MENDNQNNKVELSEQRQLEKEKLINFISSCSSIYGDKLLEFMDENHLTNLREATVTQLKTYIATHDLKPVELPKKRMPRLRFKKPIRPFKPFEPIDPEPEITR